MQKTTIEWVRNADGTPGYTWNCVSGCTPISAGCDNCYASRIANRFKGTKSFPDGFKVTLHPERLDEPRKLKGEGKRIFVCSMSDLFHDDVPDEFIVKVFDVMRLNPQHTFFVLTKRPERMLGKTWAVCSDKSTDVEMASNWYAPNIWVGVSAENQEAADKRIFVCSMSDLFHDDVPDEFIAKVFDVMKATPQHTFFVLTKRPERMLSKNWAVCSDKSTDSEMASNWYAPNIWVGVSAENQEAADRRIPVLLDLPVAHRFVSCEPLIGRVDLTDLPCNCTSITGQTNLWDYVNGLNGAGFDPQDGEVGKSNQFNHLDWIIAGGETGPGARKCEFPWIINLKSQCEKHGVPFFFKKWGSYYKYNNDGYIVGYEYREWPENV